jgi:plastocyanin
MQSKAYLTAAFATAALISLAGCGGSSGDSAKSPASPSVTTSASSTSSSHATHGAKPASASAVITIKDYGFKGPASVKPGASITIMNEDTVNHTVTADSGGAFDVTVNAGSSAKLTAPSKPGNYPYHCSFHAEMHGTLVVK